MGKNSEDNPIAAIVLAAGLSTRMGAPKQLLPWGKITIIEKIVISLINGGIQDVIVVLGKYKEEITTILRPYPVNCVYNPDFENGEMAITLTCGVNHLPQYVEAFLVVLGDQPQIEVEVIQEIIKFYEQTQGPLVVPSYQMHRGHPWLIRRDFWSKNHIQSMRDFIESNRQKIQYVNVNKESILKDIDTPEDYDREKPSDT